MLKFEKLVRKLTGKKNFILSSEIPFTYLLKKGCLFFLGLIRGKIKSFFIKKRGSNIFIGSKVKFYNSKKIFLGSNVRINNGCIIDALSTEGVILCDRVKLGENSKILCTGSLKKVGKGLYIGKDSYFSENTFFGAAGGIHVGDNVISGQNVRFHSENHNFSDKNELIRLQGVSQKGIVLGNNIWIGSGVVFLDGSKVEDGCVIAANTVVNGNFESNSIIAGNPGKVIKKR